MKKERWIIFIVLIFITSVLIFVLNDREKPPEMVTTNNTTAPKCPEGFDYKEPKNICYKENPMGHVMMTFPQIIASILTIGTIGIYEFKYWRVYLSSKLLPFKNKYVDELQAIPKSPDLFRKKGWVWVRGGFDAIISDSNQTLYVAKEELTAPIGNNLILQGALERVTPQQLFNYIGKDLTLIKEMLNLPILRLDSKGRLTETQAAPIIYLTLPEPYIETKTFTSIRGNFGFGADRVKKVLESLYTTRRGLAGYGNNLKKASQSMLKDAQDMSETAAVISDAVEKTQNTNIDSREYQQQNQNNNGREQM